MCCLPASFSLFIRRFFTKLTGSEESAFFKMQIMYDEVR